MLSHLVGKHRVHPSELFGSCSIKSSAARHDAEAGEGRRIRNRKRKRNRRARARAQAERRHAETPDEGFNGSVMAAVAMDVTEGEHGDDAVPESPVEEKSPANEDNNDAVSESPEGTLVGTVGRIVGETENEAVRSDESMPDINDENIASVPVVDTNIQIEDSTVPVEPPQDPVSPARCTTRLEIRPPPVVSRSEYERVVTETSGLQVPENSGILVVERSSTPQALPETSSSYLEQRGLEIVPFPKDLIPVQLRPIPEDSRSPYFRYTGADEEDWEICPDCNGCKDCELSFIPKNEPCRYRTGERRKKKPAAKSPKTTRKAKTPAAKSQTVTRRRAKKGKAVVPWPPLSAESFGLIQEELAHNPFQLLCATVFLNRARGTYVRPFLKKFLDKYPNPEVLATASARDLSEELKPLGFQNIRAERLTKFAQKWVESPPALNILTVKRDYPNTKQPETASPIHEHEPWGVPRNLGWEVGHLPGIGPYAIDSWRIFCRDALRGVGADAEPEWKRVVPADKELRSFIRWKWAKEGVVWEADEDQQEVDISEHGEDLLVGDGEM